jgi:hypothetical protein
MVLPSHAFLDTLWWVPVEMSTAYAFRGPWLSRTIAREMILSIEFPGARRWFVSSGLWQGSRFLLRLCKIATKTSATKEANKSNGCLEIAPDRDVRNVRPKFYMSFDLREAMSREGSLPAFRV